MMLPSFRLNSTIRIMELLRLLCMPMVWYSNFWMKRKLRQCTNSAKHFFRPFFLPKYSKNASKGEIFKKRVHINWRNICRKFCFNSIDFSHTFTGKLRKSPKLKNLRWFNNKVQINLFFQRAKVRNKNRNLHKK